MTKQGDRYLRHLLDLGARTVVRYPKARSRVDGPWIEALLERRRPMVVAVAVANKLARTQCSRLARCSGPHNFRDRINWNTTRWHKCNDSVMENRQS
ncbi:MAG TPA: hypothetical protein DIU10_15180 [Sulfitobacter sp.]|nr:hypothetical protein [Sulfitobacter sp.]